MVHVVPRGHARDNQDNLSIMDLRGKSRNVETPCMLPLFSNVDILTGQPSGSKQNNVNLHEKSNWKIIGKIHVTKVPHDDPMMEFFKDKLFHNNIVLGESATETIVTPNMK